MSERRLRNAAAPLVATVESAEELLEAVAAGTTNIEIRQHLDLRLGEDGGVDDYDALLPVFSFVPLSVRTIRVRQAVQCACMRADATNASHHCSNISPAYVQHKVLKLSTALTRSRAKQANG